MICKKYKNIDLLFKKLKYIKSLIHNKLKIKVKNYLIIRKCVSHLF